MVHDCTPDIEESSYPAYNGAFTVTVKCECGRIVNQYVDYCL